MHARLSCVARSLLSAGRIEVLAGAWKQAKSAASIARMPPADTAHFHGQKQVRFAADRLVYEFRSQSCPVAAVKRDKAPRGPSACARKHPMLVTERPVTVYA